MVVMEDISDACRQANSSDDLVQYRDDIARKIGEFHQHHYVHGDIRDANVMVRNDSAGEAGFMWVDFDRAGTIGKVRYPSNINITEVRRPEGVLDGELIIAEHDMKMLGYTLDTSTAID